ncbi:MAG: 50S ribosomal protein L15 [Candidatus Moeniiplasma glomeromycotorum]|nr:50S ribosomal protein L15 [Candidatus Moeniiplasma glomeromycotorum]MCE8170003.1 50S ribosomal protein L15 [Candidatus Moeniiplasma glomeromycotorum]
MDNNYLITIVKQRKRKGRGEGSGLGKTCGRGEGKKQGARTGRGKPRIGFEGGQTEVYLRFPKRGGRIKTRKIWKIFYQIINLEKFEKDPKIASGQTIDLTQKKFPTKVLGEGNLTKTLTVIAAAFSEEAQKKITHVGGQFQIISEKK